MEFFRDANFDFMKYRRIWVGVSAIMLTISIVLVFVHGRLNLGIDFAGGTQLTVKFKQPPPIDELRAVVRDGGVSEAVIQRVGGGVENEVMIKTPLLEGADEGSRQLVESSLDQRFNGDQSGFDLNREGSEALASLLLELDPDELRATDETLAAGHYEEVAHAVVAVRREGGLLTDWSELEGKPEISPEILAALRGRAILGDFAVLGAENVGPQIGSELRRKGIAAVALSLLGMLAYIWLRFELRFGIGAVVALVHDVLIVLGLFAIADFEFNLTTVAAFLTLVGYSVNDTVVVFDRVRENLRMHRREPLVDVMNRSINQTLSRTVLTSGTTLLAVGCLLFLGGEVLRGFGFILTVGIVVGTYSSIYVASPFALWWERLFGRKTRR